MTSVNTHFLQDNFTLQIDAPVAIPAEIRSQVDAIWAAENAARSRPLKDGRIFTLKSLDRDRLVIQPSTYRYALARRRSPALAAALHPFRPLAVTGVLVCADGVVLGRRGGDVASDIGLWEPAPAGGLSQPDPDAQLFEELREEIGLAPSSITPTECCGVVEDVNSGVFDIVYRLRTADSGESVMSAHRQSATLEYPELRVIKLAEIPEFLEKERPNLIPALPSMLRLANLI